MEDLSKIKSRIAKLLTMAKDTSSPNEAAIAAERARKLMDKYQLETFDIGEVKVEFGAIQATPKKKFPPKWKDILAVAVAKYNDCFAVKLRCTENDEYVYVQFQGYLDDVQMAKDMFDQLSDACTRQCKEYMAAQGHGSYYVARIGDAFKKGWADEVTRRLNALTKERQGLTTNAGTSLMVVKHAVLAEKFGEPKYKNCKFESRDDSEARKARITGCHAGRAHEINKAVE